MPKYRVNLFYHGSASYDVEAADEGSAVEEAKRLNNLEPEEELMILTPPKRSTPRPGSSWSPGCPWTTTTIGDLAGKETFSLWYYLPKRGG